MPKTADSDRPTLVWFRRDLRLTDNLALQAALAFGRPVIPVFILEVEPPVRGPGAAGLWWLDKSLQALAQDLESRGSSLVMRRGDAQTVLGKLVEETGATCVVWNRGYEPALDMRDKKLAAGLQARGVDTCACEGRLLLDPAVVRTKTGGPYGVFTPFWRTRPRLGPASKPRDCTQDHPAAETLAEIGCAR